MSITFNFFIKTGFFKRLFFDTGLAKKPTKPVSQKSMFFHLVARSPDLFRQKALPGVFRKRAIGNAGIGDKKLNTGLPPMESGYSARMEVQ